MHLFLKVQCTTQMQHAKNPYQVKDFHHSTLWQPRYLAFTLYFRDTIVHQNGAPTPIP